MFRIIHDAYEFILNNDVHQQTETTTRRRQAESEAARRRAEEEFARRHAEAEAQRKRAEETHRRAKEGVARQKAKEKAERKFCIVLLPINLVLSLLATLDWSKGSIIQREGTDPLYFVFPVVLLGYSINSLGLYWGFRQLTNYLIDPTRFETDGVKPYGKQFIILYTIYTIVCAISMVTDQLWVIAGSLLVLGLPIIVITPKTWAVE